MWIIRGLHPRMARWAIPKKTSIEYYQPQQRLILTYSNFGTTSKFTCRPRKTSRFTTQSSSQFGSTSLTKPLTHLRDWMFRGLLFEAEAEKFRSAGLRIGADQREAEQSLLEETLRPF